MVFKIIFADEVVYQLKKIDNKTAKRVLDKIESTINDPTHFFERLVEREDYKLRIGDYRVIARVFQNEKTIFILSFGHRKNIYKKK